MNKTSQPIIPSIISKYYRRGFYLWLLEDIPRLRETFGSNLENITDDWIIDNYSPYEKEELVSKIYRHDTMYICSRCGSRHVDITTEQMRRADEGASTVYTCVSCRHTSTTYNIYGQF